jgi:hypothetical protein
LATTANHDRIVQGYFGSRDFMRNALVFIAIIGSILFTAIETSAQCACAPAYVDITARAEFNLADTVFVGKCRSSSLSNIKAPCTISAMADSYAVIGLQEERCWVVPYRDMGGKRHGTIH